jgi:hypothetical protein
MATPVLLEEGVEELRADSTRGEEINLATSNPS